LCVSSKRDANERKWLADVCACDGGDESDRKDAEPQIASAIFVLNYEKVCVCEVDISLFCAFILCILPQRIASPIFVFFARVLG
jgi:hypothetical protein